MAAALAAAVGGNGVVGVSQAILAGAAAHEARVPNYTTAEAGNPFVAGWYADPDTAFYEGEYWVYPTASLAYEEQTYLDAFSSPDLVHWTKHARVLTTADVSWATKALWAPAPVARHGRYYLYFGANDLQEDEAAAGAVGGIGVAVADAPGGPYVDAIGRPLVGDYHHGAQPIDQAVFVDDDGQAYLYYGGHGHANVAKLNADMTSLGRFDDDDDDDNNDTAQFRSITPTDYVEGAQMLKRAGVYYFMWSEGGWQGPDYRVAYATAASPLGHFARRGTILAQDAAVARGSGHHGVVTVPGADDVHYIVYHRRPLRETDGNHRVLAYDRLCFAPNGTGGTADAILPVRMRVHDNFADGDMVGWATRGGGRWRVDGADDDAALVFAPGADDRGGAGRALLDTNFTDVVMDARVALPAGTTDDDGGGDGRAGVVFRATYEETGAGAYYAALLSRRGVVVLEKRQYATTTTMITAGNSSGVAAEQQQQQQRLGEAAFTAGPPGSSHHLRVTGVGGDLRVFVDDMTAPLLALADAQPLGAGANGVAAEGTTARFGKIAVSRPGDEEREGPC